MCRENQTGSDTNKTYSKDNAVINIRDIYRQINEISLYPIKILSIENVIR